MVIDYKFQTTMHYLLNAYTMKAQKRHCSPLEEGRQSDVSGSRIHALHLFYAVSDKQNHLITPVDARFAVGNRYVCIRKQVFLCLAYK